MNRRHFGALHIVAACALAWLSFSVLAKPDVDGMIFADGFESAAVQFRGGSNLIWYDVDAACVAEPQAILTDYHEPGVRPRVLDTLAAMFGAGQRRVSVIIFHAHGGRANPDGTVNELVLDSTGGMLDKQFIYNLKQLLADIDAAGFEEVLLRFAPQWINNPQGWKDDAGFDEALFAENWSIVRNIRAEIAGSGISYRIDLMVEGLPRARIIAGQVIADRPDNEEWTEYAQRLWEKYVDAFGTSDTIGFSSVAGPDLKKVDARVEHLNTVYRVHGEIRRPDVIGVDLYPANGLDEGQFFTKWSEELDREGLTQLPIIIPEVFYDDATAAASLQSAMDQTRRAVPFLLQWPLQRGAGCYPGDPVTVPEPDSFQHYLRHGF
ncbi:MAG: hypothetical protein KDI75_06240 [Xanthomonadales bacterium]|nr:hypothetical protein [Xanthomonadales bacterium]